MRLCVFSAERRHGFTLVELLVVISIIGVLVGLLLPAVQAARESARRTQCANHLKQVALACIQHEGAHGFLPSNGWGYKWSGDPDMGYGEKQPGGWIYDILAYFEQENVRNIGQGLSGPGPGGDKYQRMSELSASVLEVMHCPSRRSARPYSVNETPLNAAPSSFSAKTDYAANGGTEWMLGWAIETLECLDTYPNCEWVRTEESLENFDGIVTERSEVEMRHVTDGASNTLLVAEKYVNPEFYDTVGDESDNGTMYQGNDFDTTRWASRDALLIPLQDTPFVDSPSFRFGSAHSGGLNASFVDGSVRTINYDIDPIVYESFGSRDGEEIPPTL